MPEPQLYLLTMVFAASISVLCVLAVGRRRGDGLAGQSSASVLGLGVGIAVGCRMLSLNLGWPPANALDRFLLIIMPLTLAIELIAGRPDVPAKRVWGLRIALAAACPGILLYGSVYLSNSTDGWRWWQAGLTCAGCSGLLVGVWALLAGLAKRSPGVSIFLAVGLTTQAAGLTVMLAGYIKGGAVAFPLAATLIATTVAVRLVARRGDGTVPVADGGLGQMALPGIGVVSLYGVLFIGRFFGRLSTGSAVVMLLAPLCCWFTELPLLRHRPPWLIGSLRLVFVAIPLAVVLTQLKREFDRDMAPLLGQAMSETVINSVDAGHPVSSGTQHLIRSFGGSREVAIRLSVP